MLVWSMNSPFVGVPEEIGRVIGRGERQTFHLLQIGEIKSARRVGGRWCAGREALLKEFCAGAGDE